MVEGARNPIDEAPLAVRLLPALAGALVALLALGVPARRLLPPLGVVGGLVLALLLYGRRPRPPRRGGGPWECFELHVSDDAGLDGLRRFLVERSRSAPSSFRFVEEFEGGSRRLILAVSGPEGEGQVVATVVSAMLRGSVRIRPLGACEVPGAHAGARGGHVSGDAVFLGYDVDSPMPREVHLSRRDLEGHVGVYGSTGSGKSTTLRAIAARAPPGMRVVVLDWTGEHVAPLSRAGFEVVRPERAGGLDIIACGAERGVVLELLSRALDLTEPQVYMVEAALQRGAASMRNLYETIMGLPEESKWDREVKRALARKLGTLLRSAGKAFSRPGCGVLGPRRVVVDLSGIVEAYSRRAMANLFLASLFLEARRGAGETLVIVDEAHNLLGPEERSILNIVLAEARKFGLYVAYATQSPAVMGDLALLNTNTKIVHSLKSQRDKRVIIDSMGLGEEWGSRLDKLGKGEALLQAPSYPEPVLVAVEP